MLNVDSFRQKLAGRGYRATPQRLTIYQQLAQDKSHPTAEQVHNTLIKTHPTVSLATVYNTLELFVELGLAVALGFEGESRRYDGNPAPHINLRCRSCGSIHDLEDSELDELCKRVCQKSGFCLVGQRHEFYGVCPDCQTKDADRVTVPATSGALNPQL